MSNKKCLSFKMISGSQIRGARAMLNWTASILAEAASTNRFTIQKIEQSDGVPSAKAQILFEIQKALETAGIEFIGTPDNDPGVRLKSKK
jgi:DNA-binding transcriptional regulator YiaG